MICVVLSLSCLMLSWCCVVLTLSFRCMHLLLARDKQKASKRQARDKQETSKRQARDKKERLTVSERRRVMLPATLDMVSRSSMREMNSPA
jgi:hypothetical protein